MNQKIKLALIIAGSILLMGIANILYSNNVVKEEKINTETTQNDMDKDISNTQLNEKNPVNDTPKVNENTSATNTPANEKSNVTKTPTEDKNISATNTPAKYNNNATNTPTVAKNNSNSSNLDNKTASPTPKKSNLKPAVNFTLNNLSDKAVSLSDYKGKVVIINFWTTWCTYCDLEMPDLTELHKEFKTRNDVVLLAIDVQEDKDTVTKYLNKNNFSLNVLMDTNGTVAEEYGITGFPTTFFIDKEGYIFSKIPGMTNKSTIIKTLNKMGIQI